MKRICSLLVMMCVVGMISAQKTWVKADGVWKFTDAGNGSFMMLDGDDAAFRITSDNGDFMVENDNTGFVKYMGQRVSVELYDSSGVKEKSFKLWLDMSEDGKNCLKTRINHNKVISAASARKVARIMKTLNNHGSVCIKARRPGKPMFDMMISRE